MFARIYELPLGVLHGGSECEFLFFFRQAANNFAFIYPRRFGKSATCRKKRRDRSRRGFFFFPPEAGPSLSWRIPAVPLSPFPDRSLITASLINSLCVCAGMPELSGRPAGGTVCQVQREELQGPQLRLGAFRRR